MYIPREFDEELRKETHDRLLKKAEIINSQMRELLEEVNRMKFRLRVAQQQTILNTLRKNII